MVKVDPVVFPDGGVIGLAPKLAVTPAGTLETVSVTAELKPFREVTVMFDVLEVP